MNILFIMLNVTQQQTNQCAVVGHTRDSELMKKEGECDFEKCIIIS